MALSTAHGCMAIANGLPSMALVSQHGFGLGQLVVPQAWLRLAMTGDVPQ